VPSPESLPAKSANVAASPRPTEGTRAAARSGIPQSRTTTWLWIIGTCSFVVGNLFWGLTSFGLWDPWEFDAATTAHRVFAPHAQHTDHVQLGEWLMRRAFAWFGASDHMGRAPIAASAALCVATIFEWARRCSGIRVGAQAALIAATTPLLIFNARTLFGAAPDMASSGCLGVAALASVWPATSESKHTADTRDATLARALWFGAAVALIAVNTLTRGALLAVVPPLGAAVAVAFVSADATDKRARRNFALALTGLFIAVLGLIARDVLRDSTDYSPWLGGAAHKLNPPTFDAAIERVFHGFAPWSACLPLAFSYAWSTSTDRAAVAPQRHALYTACSVWIALAYGAHTLFVSRYGAEIAFLAIVPLAVWVAVALDDLAQDPSYNWAAGLTVLLLSSLLVRDFTLFPSRLAQALPIDDLTLPQTWHARGVSPLLGGFAVCAAFAVASDSGFHLDVRAPLRLLSAQWRRGWGEKLWILGLAGAVLSAFVCGVWAYALGDKLHLPAPLLGLLQKLAYLPLAIIGAAWGAPLLSAAFAKLSSQRFAPALLLAMFWGIYLAHGYLPRLAMQDSSRDVYATWERLAAKDAQLAQYRVTDRGTAYYAQHRSRMLNTTSQLLEHLNPDATRWAVLPSVDLPEIDQAYRRKTGRHLTVIETHSARNSLVTTQTVSGQVDRNPLATAVLGTVPEPIQHQVSVNFDDRIELLGYDMQLPHPSYVGAGESLRFTWYFRSVNRESTAYRLFVHLDGAGKRIHGDHIPVNEQYPIPLWEPGDVIVDRHTIDIPAGTPAGEYAIYLGFFEGNSRMPIRSGPQSAESRAQVGVLRIQ